MTDPSDLERERERVGHADDETIPTDIQDSWNVRPTFGSREATSDFDPFAGVSTVTDHDNPGDDLASRSESPDARNSVAEISYEEQRERQRDGSGDPAGG